ncbi:MAG: sugar ABC transporter permease, partial [Chloroflexota bacterium]
WQTLFYIILPMLRRSIAFVLVADTVANFLLFPPVQILTRGGPEGSTNLFMYEIYQNAFRFADYGLAYAEMVILIAIMLTIVIIQFNLLQSEEGT